MSGQDERRMSGGEAKDEEGAEAEKDEEGAEAEKGLQLSMRACGCYAKCWVRWWAGRPQFINCSSTQDANRPCARARRATECSPEPKRAIYVSRVTEEYSESYVVTTACKSLPLAYRWLPSCTDSTPIPRVNENV